MKTRLVSMLLILGAAGQCVAAEPAPENPAPAAVAKQRENLNALNAAASQALLAMNRAAAALNGMPLALPSSRTANDAQQMISLGMPAEAYFAALDQLAKQAETTPGAAGLDTAALRDCRAASQRLQQTKGLNSAAIDTRMRTENPENYRLLQESRDLQFLELARAMLVAGWLARESEAVLACLPPLQKQLSRITGDSNRELLRLEDRLQMQAIEAKTSPPPTPKTYQ